MPRSSPTRGSPLTSEAVALPAARRERRHIRGGLALGISTVWLSLIVYALLYTALAFATFYLMRKYAIAGPDAALHESVDVAPTLGYSSDE